MIFASNKIMLNSSTLRQIWLIIEQTQKEILVELSDSEIVGQIQKQLETQIFIPNSELTAANNYIQSRIPLIRDFAESQLVNP